MGRKPGKHEAPGKQPKQRGKHQQEALCSHSWSTEPEFANAHCNHQCSFTPGHRGKHLCRNFLCGEMD